MAWRGDGTGPTLFSKAVPDSTGGSQVASVTGSAFVTGLCRVFGHVVCFDFQMEKGLMILFFHSFRAVTIEKLVKEIKKKRKKRQNQQ